MKKIALGFLSLYQIIISPFIHAITGTTHACRYNVTCSQYAKEVIMKRGVLKGSLMAVKRLSTCHPFAKATVNQV